MRMPMHDTRRRWTGWALIALLTGLGACDRGTPVGGSTVSGGAEAVPTATTSPYVAQALAQIQQLMGRGESESAVEVAEVAISQEPEGPELRYALGILRLNLDDAGGGVLDFEAELARDPRHLPSLRALAGALEILAEREAALDAAERFLAIEPTDTEMVMLAGRQLSVLERHEEAIARLFPAASTDNGADVWAELGLARRAAGQDAEAIEDFRRAVEQDPTHVAATLNLGQLLLRGGFEEEGEALLERHAELAESTDASQHAEQAARQGGNAGDFHRLAERRILEGDVVGALEAYDDAIRVDPSDPRGRFGKIETLLAVGRAGDAAALAGETVSVFPDDGQAHLIRATALVHTGDLEGAERSAQRSRDLRTWTPSSWLRFGEAYYDAGRVALAVSAFREALALDPENRSGLLTLGQALYFSNDYAGARDAFTEAARVASEDGDAALALGLSLWALDDSAAAEDALRDANARYTTAGVDVLGATARFAHWPGAQDALAWLRALVQEEPES